MDKPRLNKKQRAWVNSFVDRCPGARIREIHAGCDGDRIVTLEWTEFLPSIILPDCADSGSGWFSYSLKAKLRKYGDVRYSPDCKYRLVYPHCQLDHRYHLEVGQLSLPLPQLLSTIAPDNPVKIPTGVRRKSIASSATQSQLKLPLFGVASQLHQIHLRQGKPTVSEQELLSETVAHRDLDTGKDIKLPTAIALILADKQASLDEWQSAIALYQVAGATGVVMYLEGLEDLRSHFGTDRRLKISQSSPVKPKSTVVVVPH
ncbi:MAG: hypothetical protein KME17_23850 [Cyanosarcina radialis HA8281-LM2]|jgi:hypothetical protein|nr:hypothetical protein [Cyanosarcina radialis HA8281-LM2]